uniref:Uncharacterized protein n=1 Tax=Anopheles coluzzii TaxID=1518534 RepID=A0A8W7PR10_ANOCL
MRISSWSFSLPRPLGSSRRPVGGSITVPSPFRCCCCWWSFALPPFVLIPRPRPPVPGPPPLPVRRESIPVDAVSGGSRLFDEEVASGRITVKVVVADVITPRKCDTGRGLDFGIDLLEQQSKIGEQEEENSISGTAAPSAL